jgi:hypothetical protein
MNSEDNCINSEDNCINGDLENTILITLKDTNNLVKILYDKISLLENESAKFKKQLYYLNKSLTELKESSKNNDYDLLGTDTDLNDFIVNSLNNKNVSFKDNNDSIINESDIINEINFNKVKDVNNKEEDVNNKVDKEEDVNNKVDKDYIKNKLKKLIVETQQHSINNNKRKKNMLFTMR